MKTLALALLFTATACVATEPRDQNFPSAERAAPSESHAWLQQLVGDWDASAESVAEPGSEPDRWKGTESVRTFGDLWVVAEGIIPEDDEDVGYVLTLGFDTDQGAFVGSWIDTMQTRMWTYRGSLDDGRRVLTLEAEGPSITDPSRTAQYRDQVEVVDPDHRRMISSMLGDDGTWQRYMTVDYRRRR